MKNYMTTTEMKEISSTLLKGKITELKCELWFLERGQLVSIPEVPYQYGFLVDVNGKIIKIQVKTSSVDKEKTGITFRVCSITHNNNGYARRNYSENDVDYFMTYYEEKCYLIPFSDCGVKEKKLRLIPPKNGQVKGISFAEDYLAEKILGLEEVIEQCYDKTVSPSKVKPSSNLGLTTTQYSQRLNGGLNLDSS